MHLVSTLGLQYFEKAKITQYDIEYRLQYSLFFKRPSKSIISLLFGELSNINYSFTFLGIDSQPWVSLSIFASADGPHYMGRMYMRAIFKTYAGQPHVARGPQVPHF